jgi:hypothetical protein
MQKNIKPTMFASDVVGDIGRCMRFYPHQNDSGGFFVAVLVKNAEMGSAGGWRASPHPWRELPFLKLSGVTGGNKVYEEIRDGYGIDCESNLFVRAESKIRSIYYLSNEAADLVGSWDPKKLRAMNCGVRMFSYKKLDDEGILNAFPCQEGVAILAAMAKKRIIEVDALDAKKMINAGNGGISVLELSEKARIGVMEMGPGGVIVRIGGSRFVYGGMKRGKMIVLQLKKDRISMEVFKIEREFGAAELVLPDECEATSV